MAGSKCCRESIKEIHANDFTEHFTSKAKKKKAPLTEKFFWCSVLRENRNKIKFQYFWIWLLDGPLSIRTLRDLILLY